ncbi:MAG: molybdenum cofactor guanylyltransferase [Armatimonadota bacterium]
MAVIILAGGQSSRMGTDKAWLPIDGTSILESLVERFGREMGRVIVVVRPDQEQPLPLPAGGPEIGQLMIVTDTYCGVGPLGGLQAGLAASPDDENFALACDLAFAEPRLARWVLSHLGDYDAAVPMLARGPEPLFAAYSRSSLAVIEASIAEGRLRLRDALERLDVCYISEDQIRGLDPGLRSFHNINTPEDYRDALRAVRSSQRRMSS